MTIEQFRGKRLLLVSFDAGNFVNGGLPIEEIRARVQATNRAIKKAGPEHLAAVGFTAALEFFAPPDSLPGESCDLSRLTEFELVNITNRKFNEPYSLLLRPSAIVIDSAGVIQSVHTSELTPAQIAEAAKGPDWSGPTRKPPLEDPWQGKPTPTLRRTFSRLWTLRLPGGRSRPRPARSAPVLGLGHGDWNSDGLEQILAVTSDGRMNVIGADGRIRPESGISTGLRSVSSVIECAQLRPGTPAAFQAPEGWPNRLTLMGNVGRILWSFEPPVRTGIDSAAWADLNGDGCMELIVGCNGASGLHVVDCDNKLLWSATDIANAWEVAGLSAHDGQPGRVMCTTAEGAIRVYGAAGFLLRRLPNQGRRVTYFAAAEMTPSGNRQVLARWPAYAGAPACVAAADAEGALLWRFPIEAPRYERHGMIQAAALAGDGAKQWIVEAATGELVVLDRSGELLARMTRSGSMNTCWTALPRMGQTGLIVVSNDDDLVAYTLAPQ